jgi:LuxR family maltose regulon positive regulatory protein
MSRVALLTAPAGYGKTTLARQWVGRRKGPVIWYRAPPASSDVAALASGLQHAFAAVVDPMGDRLNDRLRTTTDPEGDADQLAQLLAQDIAALPEDAYLVIDDYQHMIQEPAAERFVSAFLDQTTMPLLITTRVRPSWVAAKNLLYGDVLELGRNVLAMTHEEAEAVLIPGPHERGLSGLVALAEGWPAVIGLAALLPDPFELSTQTVPDSLYSYFAEELYQGMPRALQWHVAQLSLAPSVTGGLARELFGPSALRVIDVAYNRGFLTKESDRSLQAYELHPLLRQFLRHKLNEFTQSDVHESAEAMGRWYLDHADWDAAFALASEFASLDLLRRVIERGIDPILAEGRLSTVDQWIDLGHRLAPADPVVRLAEVEATFRRGRWRDAESKATRLVSDLPEDHHLAGRVLLRAGQIAHLDDRHGDALELLARAGEKARTPWEVRRALWSQFITLSDLEEPSLAWETLLQLEQLPPETTEDLLRASQARLHWANRWGGVEAELERQAESLQLITKVPDPVVRTGFLQTYATALGLAARYSDMLEIGKRELHDAEACGLVWVRPHALEIKGLAQLGLRSFDAALSTLKDAHSLATGQANLHSQVSSVLLSARVFLSRGEKERAIQVLSTDWDRDASRGLEGEYLATKALALACCDESHSALHNLRASEAITDQIDGRVLRSFVRAIIAHRSNDANADGLLQKSISEARTTGNVDAFVSAYRAEPSLLERMSDWSSTDALAIRRVVCTVDRQLAERAGFEISRDRLRSGLDLLTPREGDVFDLLRQGLTNREIARGLWIEESTVKVHVRHILRKLGVRSRTEAAGLEAQVINRRRRAGRVG